MSRFAITRPFAFLDVETTGFDPRYGHRILEVAVLRVEPDGTERRFVSLVQPYRPIPPETTRVHGISDEDVEDAPPFSAVATEVERLLRGATIVAHNARFDLGFLAWHFAYAGRPSIRLSAVDTLAMARSIYGRGGNSLRELARAFGVRARSRHRALADVLTLRGILPHLLRARSRQTGESLRNSWRAIGRFSVGPPSEPPEPPFQEVLQAAIRRARPVRFEYRAPGGPRRIWEQVVPIECAACAEGWVVRVRTRDPWEVTHFRADRLRRLALQ